MSTSTALAAQKSITLIPDHINQGNLATYDRDTKKEIENIYQQIKAQAFKGTHVTNDPTLTVIFGSTGTGVTTLMNRLIDDQPNNKPVVCNAEKFAGSLPSFQHDIQNSQQDFELGMEAVRQSLIRATERFLPAGKYMQDRLMEDALNEGRSVMVAKRGRTNGGIHLLEAINNAGVALHTIIYQAPLSVKSVGYESRYSLVHDIGLTPEQIAAEHYTLTNNMTKLAEVPADRLSLYFRMSGAGEITLPVAVRDANGPRRVNEVGAHQFDGYFADSRISVDTLMGFRPA